MPKPFSHISLEALCLLQTKKVQVIDFVVALFEDMQKAFLCKKLLNYTLFFTNIFQFCKLVFEQEITMFLWQRLFSICGISACRLKILGE